MMRCKDLLLISVLFSFASGVTAGPGYELAVEDTMRRVRIDVPYTGERAKAGALTVRPHPGSLPKPPNDIDLTRPNGITREAKVSAAQGESEGFQVVILAKDIDLQDVTLSATTLTPVKGGEVAISPTQFTFNQVGYVKTAKPAYPVERTGWFADPLLNPSRFNVKQGDVQPVWVTIRIPINTPPGVYTGKVFVTPKNAEKSSISVTLRVWGFAIPEGSHLRMAFTWDEGATAAIHGTADWKDKNLKYKYMDCLLAHRMGVDNIYRGSPPKVEDVKYAMERGAGNFNLFNVGWPKSFTDAQIETTVKRIDAVWKTYEDAGIADKAYVFGFDENYQEIAIPQIYGAIGKRFPKLKRLASTGPRGKPADDHVDIWAMSLGSYFAAMKAGHLERLQPKGVQFWLYLSTSAGPPRPNWWIESALIESRSLFWLAYEVDADGCLYYFINHAETRPTPIDENAGPYTRWDPRSFPGHNGDGQLIYAGKNGPLASVRMANIRDGVEDHEYLKRLERLLVEKGKAKNRAEARNDIKERFVRHVGVNFWIHTHQEEVLRAMRDRVAEEIEKLSKMVDVPKSS